MTAAAWQSNSSTSGNGTTTGATVSVPGGVADGDLLILTVATSTNSASSPATHNTPSGWTLITSLARGGQRSSAFWRIAASEPADYSPTWSSQTGGHLLTINRFTGAAASSPIDVSGTGSANSSTATAPTVTTTVADTLLCAIYSHTATGGNKFSQPPGMTERWDIAGTGGNGPGVALDTEAVSAAGATGTRASTCAWSDHWTAIAFAIKPAAGTTHNVSLTGALTTAGSAAKQDQKPLSGTLTSSGAVVKLVNVVKAGALTLAGSLITTVSKIFAGALTLAGSLITTVVGAVTSQRGTVTLAESALHTATLTESALHTCTLAESA